MTEEVTFPADDAEVQEFNHPNGETGIIIGIRSTAGDVADAFDFNPAVDTNDPDEVERMKERLESDDPVVFPLKHKADGATNFSDYREDGDDLVVVFEDDQYEQVRDYFQHSILYQ